MKTIRIIYDQTAYTYRWLSALVFAKKEFKDAGYKLVFPCFFKGLFSRFDVEKIFKKGIKKANIIMVAIHPNSDLFKGKEPRVLKLLEKLKGVCDKLIWLDTSDSAGTTFFEALTYADYYLKKQLYSDLSMYSKKYMLDRFFCDHYYKNVPLFSNIPFESKNIGLPTDKINRIGLSWNIGLGMPLEKNHFRFLLNLNRTLDKKYDSKRHSCSYDVYFNGTVRDGIIGYQRKLAINAIVDSQLTHPEVIQKVNTKKYFSDLRKSRFLVSPYGWGEICTRDFEAFKNGCVLVKADMSILKTYPNFYIPYETYIPCDIDFRDFENVINNANKKETVDKILENVNKIFQFYYSKEGKRQFVMHILKNIEEKGVFL